MKVLVFPHHLEIGGSQTNAIDLATAVRDRHGHEVVFFARTGPASVLLQQRGFELVAAPTSASPSPRAAWALGRLLSRRHFDLVHAWDWPQCLDAQLGAQLRHRLPVLGSIMSMDVLGVLPPSMPVTYGTPELVERARRRSSAAVWLLEPPVDTTRDDGAAVDGATFRRRYGVADGEVAVVVVSRLVSWLKLDGLRRSIRAAAALADLPVRLLVVGGGPAQAELQLLAEQVNCGSGREVVTLTGGSLDPRPAYAAADVVLGMGGSVLRGMAFGKPAIVLGEHGFAETFDPHSAAGFLTRGLYGNGNGEPDDLPRQLRELVVNGALRQELGDFSRRQVLARYGLGPCSDSLAAMYAQVVSAPPTYPRLLLDTGRTVAWRAAGRLKQVRRSRAPAAPSNPAGAAA